MSVFTDGTPPRVKYVRPRYYSATVTKPFRLPRLVWVRWAGLVVGVALVRKRQRVVSWARPSYGGR